MFIIHAHKKSAVERLEESKAHYVKTESVLDGKQRLEHASHLQVPIRPQVDVFLISSTKIASKSQPKSPYQDPRDFNRRNRAEQEEYGQPTASRHLHRVTYNIFKTTQDDAEFQYNCSFPPNSYNLSMPPTNNTNFSHQTKSSEMQSSACDSTLILNSGAKMSLVTNAIRNLESSGHCRSFEALEKEQVCMDRLWRNPSNGFHSESEGRSSGEESRESSSFEVAVTQQDTDLLPKTCDYVSRSSSFRCNVTSDRVKALVSTYEAKMNQGNCHSNQDKSMDRRRVSRSKSDVGHKFTKNLVTQKNVCSNNNNDNALERFFDSMGLDTTVWHHLNSRPLSPARFFDSISSLNSEDHHSSVCSEESEGHREGLTNKDLQKHGHTDTSIVEKNARVVKWLYNCRNTYKKSSD